MATVSPAQRSPQTKQTLRKRLGPSLLLVTMLLLLLSGTLAASTVTIPSYFTANMAATGTDPAVTVMEQALLDRLNGATTSIDAAFYDFNRDSIRDALIAAHNRGVTVRVITDDEARLHIESYIPYYAALESAGIPVKDDQRENSIMHNKYFIIDGGQSGVVVWTGSTNMTDNGFTLNHNNGLAIQSQPLADLYQADFDQMWAGNFSKGKDPATSTSVTVDGRSVGVYFSPEDGAMGQLIDQVNAAQSTIDFAIFFFTDDNLRDALIAAKQRGVTVRGLWDNLGAASPFSEDEILCDGGIAIRTEDTRGKMHHKFMVVDAGGAAPRVITGSMNWTNAGDNTNDENTLILQDPILAEQYRAGFDAMWHALDISTQCGLGDLPHRIFLPLAVNGAGTVNPADVQIASIVYNPDGDDLVGEMARLENLGSGAQNLTGWTLEDEAGATFTFPAFTLLPGEQVRIWVRAGTDSAADLFWGRNGAVWNNGGDTAILRDENGTQRDLCTYPGGGVEVSCN